MTAVDFSNRWAVDEIVVLDVTRNKNKRQQFLDVVLGLSKKFFVPLTIGGWVDSLDEVLRLLRLGADKVVINTEAVRRPSCEGTPYPISESGAGQKGQKGH